MYGFYNQLLRVDLSARTWAAEEIPDDVLIARLGGKGLATRLLLENAPPGVDPLAPENPLIIATGPATGTVLAPASRYGLFTKSPLTGILSESYAGGHVAPQIKATGYDAILLQGASDAPVYLGISDKDDRVRPLEHELPRCVVIHLPRYGVQEKTYIKAAYLAAFYWKEIEEERPVDLGLHGHHLPAKMPGSLAVDMFEVGGLPAQARPVVDDLRVDLSAGVVEDNH